MYKLRAVVLLYLGAMVWLVLSQPAKAQESRTARPEPKQQVLSFEDELIEGGNQKPDLFFLFQKRNFNYNRLIRLRENFLPEMRQTSEDVQRSRREN